ncbi:MAG TPA: type II toxin-antitoxin system prevent-host-death family antitoxin, partial [Pseudomonadota bacterium]|nr:type II toxin-antitoxin system prevent-host-death family antitoxin [Pseudomonadota bacterium]
MKAVSARHANQRFSELLSQVEGGQEIVITKRGHPVAVLSPYRAPAMTREWRAAIKRALKVIAKGFRWRRLPAASAIPGTAFSATSRPAAPGK